MLTYAAALLCFNGLALAGVLALSRYSVTLVDDEGRRLDRSPGWQERVVAASEPVRSELAV